MRVMRLGLAVVMVSMLILGCATVGPEFKKPTVETPTRYRTGGEPDGGVVDLKWWELFNDPVLHKIVATALENNRDLFIAASRIEQARANLGFIKADEFPRVNIDAGVSGGNFSGGSRSPNTNATAYIAPVLKWEIDFWGKFRRSTEAARADLMASEYALRTVQLSLISQVVSTYYQLLDYHQRLEISHNTLASRRKSLEIIRQRHLSGLIPEIDLNQAQIQKEIAAAAIPLYQRLIAKTENTLSLLLGRLPREVRIGAPLNHQPVPPQIPTGLPSSLLERRPDIIAATYLLAAQTARIGVAEALRLPSISLTGALGAASTELASVTSTGGVWSAGGGLLGPLIDFDKNRQRVQVEKEKTRQVFYQYENTVLTAFREIEDGLAEVTTYREQIQSVERKLTASRNANELSKDRYDQGVTSYLEVLDTERTLFSVEIELSELRQSYFNAYVTVYKALGGGWLTPEEVVETTDPETTPRPSDD